MMLGVLWYSRVPPGSAPWRFGTGAGASILPPTDYLVHFFPGVVLFGIGLMIMVAPLTTAVMTSVPESTVPGPLLMTLMSYCTTARGMRFGLSVMFVFTGSDNTLDVLMIVSSGCGVGRDAS